MRTFFALGLAHPVLERLHLDGHASLAIGPTFQDGRSQLLVRDEVTFRQDAGAFTFRLGLSAGVSLDLTRASQSFAELGIPFSVRVWQTIEMVYRPYLELPLGRDAHPVFAGTSARSADFAFVPFECLLRFRVAALGF